MDQKFIFLYLQVQVNNDRIIHQADFAERKKQRKSTVGIMEEEEGSLIPPRLPNLVTPGVPFKLKTSFAS